MKIRMVLVVSVAAGLSFLAAERALALYGVELAAPAPVGLAGAPAPLVLEAEKGPTSGEKVNIQNVDCVSLTAKGQWLEIPFELTNAANVRVWVKVYSIWPQDSDTFFWSVDGGAEQRYTSCSTNLNPNTTWIQGFINVWNWARLGEVSLSAGKHTLAFTTRSGGGGVAFDKAALAFDDDLSKAGFLGADITNCAQAQATRHVFDKSKGSLPIENEDFDKVTGKVVEVGASGGKAVLKEKEYERDLVAVDFPKAAEVEVWVRVWLEAKNFVGGYAIEEYLNSAYVEVDGRTLGVAYAVDEKRWYWTYGGRVKCGPGRHVFSVFKKGKPGVMFDRVMLYGGKDARSEMWFAEEFAEKLPFGMTNAVAANDAPTVSNWRLLGSLAGKAKLGWVPSTQERPYANAVELGEGVGELVLEHQLGLGLIENGVFNPRRTPQQLGLLVNGDGAGAGVGLKVIFYDRTGEAFEGVLAEKVDWKGWQRARVNLLGEGLARHEGGNNDGRIDWPITIKYLVVEKRDGKTMSLKFEEPELRRDLWVRARVAGKGVELELVNPGKEANSGFIVYELHAAGKTNVAAIKSASGLLKVPAGGVAKAEVAWPPRHPSPSRGASGPLPPMAATGEGAEGIQVLECGVNDGVKQRYHFCVGDETKHGFKAYLEELEKKCGAYRVAPEVLGKDGFQVQVDGVDVTSAEYADKMGYGDDCLRLRTMDLSDASGWPEIYVQPGFVGVDRKLGRVKFAEGDNDTPGLVSRCATGFGVHGGGFTIKGDRIYCRSGEGADSVINLSTPEKPVHESLNANWHFHGLLMPLNDYFLFNSSRRGISVYDTLANPFTPGPFRQLDFDLYKYGKITKLFEEQALAYLDSGVIVDLKRPLLPRIVKEDPVVKEIGPGYFAAGVPFAYGGFKDGQIGVYDIKNPLAPKRLSDFAFPLSMSQRRNIKTYGAASIADVADGQLIAIVNQKEIHIFDAADPARPVFKMKAVVKGEKDEVEEDETTLVIPAEGSIYIQGACVAQNYLYVLDRRTQHRDTAAGPHVGFSRVFILDISGRKPVLKNTYQETMPSGFSFAAVFKKDYLVIDDFCYGIRIFSIKDREKLVEVGKVLTGGEVRHGGYVSDDDIAVVSHTFDGVVQTIDVSDPERPRRVGQLADGDPTFRTCAIYGSRFQGKGKYLYAPKPTELQIIAISDPGRLKKIGTFCDTNGTSLVAQIAVRGNLACVAANKALLTFDVKTPEKPVYLGKLEPVVGFFPVLSGQYCYLLEGAGKRITKIDISNPAAPKQTAVFNLADYQEEAVFGSRMAASLAISKGYMYALTGGKNKRLNIFDVSGEKIVWLKRVPLPRDFTAYSWADFIEDITLSGNILSTGNYGRTTLYDISDPLNPKLIYCENVVTTWITGTIRGGYLYYPGLEGLLIFDLPDASQVPAGKVTAQ